MRFTTLTKVTAGGSLPLLLSLARTFATPVYRAAFLAGASGSGVLAQLAAGPRDVDTLADALGITADRTLLRAWLDLGVQLGELSIDTGCYRLAGRTAKALARPRNDAVAAALEEVMRFHVPVLLNGPAMLGSSTRLTLADQDGAIIARSSRVIAAFVEEAVERVLDREAPLRLLEIGCGSGDYVRYAAELNPRLTALAVDYQPEVAAAAAADLTARGLSDRIEVRHADIRDLHLEPQFDLITMHNNIYYFPVDERIKLLEHARSLLAPGGRILLTTSCRGGNLSTEVLGLWFEFADFGGPLPDATELAGQLRQAGFEEVAVRRLIPGEQFCSFVAANPRPESRENRA
ncbi:methyltransferase domain-containing protein [Nocardia sp. 2]|uniref:Methyltransferase domain-containing protein n=1 Tax=Nocardia acididurans TaxID=2802282 RepID=A0ABS1M5H5_9NOCA|nr:class I SAM-dependent methyltransferase [Nocardia acididurans]MBL1075898.1 methyltransferase domain-containing protein [Nocardia acididurans]